MATGWASWEEYVAYLRERLVKRAIIGRQRAKKLDSTVDDSRQAAEEFIDLLYDYIAARFKGEEN